MKKIFFSLTILTTLLVGCKDSFLDRPPLDRITIDNFYQNEDQIKALTGNMYGSPWFNFNDKSFIAMGDGLAGNLFTYGDDYIPFVRYTVLQSNVRLVEGWESLYRVVANANSVINDMPPRAKGKVSEEVINQALAEAHYMRAQAYYYLSQLFGPIPIIENGEKLATGDFKVPRNNLEDVYKFMKMDLDFAEANGAKTKQKDGRVSIWTAKALAAKLAMITGKYGDAKLKAEEVINSGQYSLMADYNEVFKTKNNNNSESIFALQWVACADCWGQQNTAQAYLAPYGEGLTESGDGWGSVSPSLDILRAYEKSDKRIRASVMLPGVKYPELVSTQNPAGYTYPLKAQNVSPTQASIRKYIVGSPKGSDGPTYFMRTGINTNIIRYSDILLIAAEAIMNGAQSTSDATATKYFNLVRERAGLSLKREITQDDILKERRIELAFEFDYWFTLLRQKDRSKVKQLLADTERGAFYSDTEWYSAKYTPKDQDFTLPIPQQETDQNPRLKENPVPYTFK
jgi:starch-binding outer membrane protein, SusD/RagB family